MFGFGGRYYWGRKHRGKVEGIVVVFAWMSSKDQYLKNYIGLYSSLGWNSLVCHSQFLNLFFPDKAASLALEIVNELVQELKLRPCPVVFASFSGGPKACLYKVFQIIDGNYEAKISKDDCQLVRDCVAGHIFDSLVDFISDVGARFVLHPTIIGMSQPPPLASRIAHSISSTLNALFLSRFESQPVEYWQTLYSTVRLGAPYLILCSEDDDLAPFQVIHNFSTRLEDLGAEVKLVKWKTSSHVGHFQNYPLEYMAVVTELLGKASYVYSQRIRQLEGEKMGMEGATPDQISDPFRSLRKAMSKSNQTFQRIALDLNDHFLVPSSLEYHEERDVGSVQDKHRDSYIPLSSPSKINAHGVLGQFLFDACVPKNVEDWDLSSSPSFRGASIASSRTHSHFNPIKCILRSRL